jgi:hypothetical protein
MKSIILFCSYILLLSCSTNRDDRITNLNKDIDGMTKLEFVVSYEDIKEKWEVELLKTPRSSCYFSESKSGLATIGSDMQPVQIGYIRSSSGYVLETKPGICDSGKELSVSISDRKYIGLVQSRSISGYKIIGHIFGKR